MKYKSFMHSFILKFTGAVAILMIIIFFYVNNTTKQEALVTGDIIFTKEDMLRKEKMIDYWRAHKDTLNKIKDIALSNPQVLQINLNTQVSNNNKNNYIKKELHKKRTITGCRTNSIM